MGNPSEMEFFCCNCEKSFSESEMEVEDTCPYCHHTLDFENDDIEEDED